ncbi:MAG: hypothetical protein PHU98_06065 [Mariniphaga sp.]|nr:hypothetical protein [Paludibacter sp.]MDD4225935.1 hypothetical protein [Mariniphaga sp.]
MITICSLYTKDIEDYAIIGNRSKIYWCKKQGYKFVFLNEILDNTRPAAWSKLLLLQQELNLNPDTSHVVWIDADTYILNYDFDIQKILDEIHTLFISKDFNGINAGIFAITNTQQSKDLISSWWGNTKHIGTAWQEQNAIMEWYKELGPIEIQRLVKIIPQYMINAYPNERYFEMPNIIHLAGVNHAERTNMFIKLYKKDEKLFNCQ